MENTFLRVRSIAELQEQSSQRPHKNFAISKISNGYTRTTGTGNVQQSQVPLNPVNQSDDRSHSTDVAIVKTTTSAAVEQDMCKFVPEMERYRCFIRSCKYQKAFEKSDKLQQHIEIMHGSDREFTCPHCGIVMTAAKQVLNHLRYHGSRIYKCASCAYNHYMKKCVDKHIDDLHPNVGERTRVLDRAVRKRKPTKSAVPPKFEKFKWYCNNCSAIFDTCELVKKHLFAKHHYANTNRSIRQFECTLCQYSDDSKSKIELHMITDHAQNDLKKVKCNYYSKSVNTSWNWYDKH